jgi:hypothetical protein
MRGRGPAPGTKYNTLSPPPTAAYVQMEFWFSDGDDRRDYPWAEERHASSEVYAHTACVPIPDDSTATPAPRPWWWGMQGRFKQLVADLELQIPPEERLSNADGR